MAAGFRSLAGALAAMTVSTRIVMIDPFEKPGRNFVLTIMRTSRGLRFEPYVE